MQALEQRVLLAVDAAPETTSWVEMGRRLMLGPSEPSAVARDVTAGAVGAATATGAVEPPPMTLNSGGAGGPLAPPIPDLHSSSDSGVSNTDNLTNVTRPIVEVTASEAGTLRLYVDGNVNLGGSMRVPGPGTYAMRPVGPLSFNANTVVTTGTNAYALTSADVNNDTRLDLLTANLGSHTLTVHFGNGDGTFAPDPVTTTRPSGPHGVAAADFNRDGDVDVVLTNNSASAFVLFGNGDGTFGNEVPLALQSGNFVLNVAAGDVNNDGNPDVLAAERGSFTVRVILGNGNGTFQPGVSYPAGGQSPFDPQIADANGDGRPDIFVSNHVVDTVTVLLGNGDGTFQPPRSSPTGDNPVGFAPADYDRDGILDVMVSENGEGTVSFLKGNGDGTFAPRVPFLVDFNNQGGVAGDFNLDGWIDYATTSISPAQINVLLGNGDGTFRPYLAAGAGASVFELIGADFNADGQTDLAFADFTNGNVPVFISVGGHLSDGAHTAYATLQDTSGNLSPNSPTLNIFVDTIRPVVTGGAFRYDNVPSQRVNLTFSENVGPTLSTADLTLSNLTSGGDVPASHMALNYAPGPNEATFTFPGYANGVLPDGDYRATLAAAGVTDPAGNALAGDHLVNFFFLQADPTRDRRVNLEDFNVLAANFGQSPRTFSTGDFNYDGTVNLQDFNILAQRFGTVLPTARGGGALTGGFGGADDGGDDEDALT